jgi:hypothetical protein
MRGLNCITFDTTDLTLQPDEKNTRVWLTAVGDMVTLNALSRPLDFSANPAELESIRARSRAQIARYRGAIVEVELCTIGGLAAVREILKIPQTPTGMGYLGSFTLPWRDGAYLLSVACQERGVTGMRDTAILARLMQSGEVSFERGKDQPENWMQDPYDPSIVGPPARNRADDESYDSLFPEHPLSQVRHLLRQIGGSFQLASDNL